MVKHLRASLWLLFFTVLICCVLYPLVLWGIGQAIFPDKANGSLILDKNGAPIGSLLIAQPFSADEYFHPRPSAASYNGAASTGSNLGASNPALRDRVARALGPIVKYSSGPKKGELVAGDVDAWFQQDKFQGKPAIVAQWADARGSQAQAWVGTTFDAKSPTPQQQYVLDWAKTHPDVVTKFKADNPDVKNPAPADLAVVFFDTFAKENAGKFPTAVTKTGADGKSTTSIEPAKDGSDIQSIFFDMWLSEHPDAQLQQVPADMVMASGSGLDPHITLDNALYQLDRVAAARATKTKQDRSQVRGQIEKLLQEKADAPLNGLVGVKLVNVLEVNLAMDSMQK